MNLMFYKNIENYNIYKFIVLYLVMAGASGDVQTEQEVNLTYTWLILDTIKRMRDAHSENDKWKYKVHGEFAIQMMLPYYTLNERKDLDKEFKELQTAKEKIDAADLNEQTKEKLKLEEEVNFVSGHKSVIMMGLSRIGVTKVADDALIDWLELNMPAFRYTIRHGESGVPSSLEEFLAREVQEYKKKKEDKEKESDGGTL
jgi:hypothetical protein